MRTTLLFLMFCCNFPFAKGQASSQNVDRNYGNLLYRSQYEEIKGSQFYNNEWMAGNAVADNGTIYKNLQLKFDAYGNKIVFNRNDTAFEVEPAAKEVRLFNPNNSSDTLVFRKGFTISPKVRPDNYVQVMAEGKITLLKFIQKDIETYTEFSDATKYKRFTQTDRYYTCTGGQYQEIKLSKKTLEDLLSDKSQAVSSYLSQQKLNGKDERSWAMAIKYYNGL